MRRLIDRWLPMPHLDHPWPEQRFDGPPQGKGPLRGSAARWDLCGGTGSTSVHRDRSIVLVTLTIGADVEEVNSAAQRPMEHRL
jgi:hypothetical protein